MLKIGLIAFVRVGNLCNVDVAFEEAVTCAMATESYLTGRRVEWDPIKRRLV